MSTLDQVMEQARTAAATIAAAPAAIAAAPVATLNTSLTPTAAPATQFGRTLSLADSLVQGGMAVDAWLKITADGLKVDDEAALIQHLDVSIDLDDVAVVYSARAEMPGNNVVYVKSPDGVVTDKGTSYQAELDRLTKMTTKKVDTWIGYELPMVLLSNQAFPKTKGSGTIDFSEGDVIGHASSVMVSKEFRKYLTKLAKAGVTSGVVRTRIDHDPRTSGSNKYGVITFTQITN